MRVLLDLDGVVCDFVGGVMRHFDTHVPYPAGEWDVCKVLGMEPKRFWPKLGYDFWVGLEKMHDADSILATLDQYDTCVLTSPTWDPQSAAGKQEWIRRNLPKRYHRSFLIGPAKHYCAGPLKVLIDDSDNNVKRFREEGGSAILVPRQWNSGHNRKDLAIWEIEQELRTQIKQSVAPGEL